MKKNDYHYLSVHISIANHHNLTILQKVIYSNIYYYCSENRSPIFLPNSKIEEFKNVFNVTEKQVYDTIDNLIEQGYIQKHELSKNCKKYYYDIAPTKIIPLKQETGINW